MIDQKHPEWERMWAALCADSINADLPLDVVACWMYMGDAIRLGHHCFKNRYIPKAMGGNVTVFIPWSEEYAKERRGGE